jgi:hypothetical protein
LSHKIPWLWFGLTIAAQIVTALKPILMYSERVTKLFAYSSELGNLRIEAERNWLKVANGTFTDEETVALIYEYRVKLQKANDKYMEGDSFMSDPAIAKIAIDKAAENVQKLWEVRV